MKVTVTKLKDIMNIFFGEEYEIIMNFIMKGNYFVMKLFYHEIIHGYHKSRRKEIISMVCTYTENRL